MKQQKVIVFLPAFNEEESIVEVIQKIPRHFNQNVSVEVIVINDGSSDRTEELSWEAGADYVHTFPKNKGLGAAVRKGLELCVSNGADIGVMIDADNEYPAEQIPELIEPILLGTHDYVMGSRFLGTIKGMRWNRRLGNYCFTFLQALLLRKWIYDGQSGMRAFSRHAMIEAEIIHDYNYAQVVTLNLIRKGFRMKEIPIRYQVRKTGESFIKFKAYMTSVLPAILKEMRRPVKKEDRIKRKVNGKVHPYMNSNQEQ
ncbi:glycosyltransferase family 2 protein [Paenibacillus sp. BSR1-1]|uniref:glycosyltransferase family 2 protein n=1 Tax=Paenibacillus sp. BSR1-1 TaxID=3020845 RepID=UPI0025B23C46|nr:glycosyltransferase family 2 protein [Paenibacillus sp. BSR1-1]MDN3018797.1 glycosyltransferase family 2 protein [Paenibacillus sp. BSR1-1]